ncbi:MAG: AsmA family protein [Beijerinckiaceae bacterium]|nr:AsmA family protein [Beijerinckiaceae bacterium]
MRFFREILTVLAGLLVLLLGAALAGPYFVDWNKHKPLVVGRLAQATGATIHVAGDIDLKLLPSPRLRLGRVTFAGQKSGSPQLEAETLYLELGLTALLRGQIRLVEAIVQRPHMQVTMQANGGFVLPDFPAAGPWQIAFEHVAFQDARVTVLRPGGLPPLQVSGLSLDASGQSLEGPFRGNGTFALAGDTITYSFNTGAVEQDSLRAKLVAQSSRLSMRGEFDGALKLDAGAGRVATLAFSGTATLAGQVMLPGAIEQKWRASGPLVMDADGIRSEAFDLRAGEEARTVSATGAFEAFFRDAGDPKSTAHATLTLAAQQINADALLGGEGPRQPAMAVLADWLQQLAAQKRLVSFFPVPVDLEIAAAALTLGQDTLSKVSLKAKMEPGKPVSLAFAAGAPGTTSLTLNGTLETGAAALLRSHIAFATRDMRRLEQWLGRGLPRARQVAAAAPYRSFRLAGNADISRAGIAARDLQIYTGRSQFSGTIIYTKSVGAERARLHVDLVSPALDIDGLGDFSAPARALGDIDFDAIFDARAVRLAQFGKGVVDAGEIKLRLERKDGVLRLPLLDIRNLGGANVAATGSLEDGEGRAEVTVDAKNLVQVSQLLARVAPGPWSAALVTRAAALSPASLKVSMRATSATARPASTEAAEVLVLNSLEVAGDLNGTKVRVRSGRDQNNQTSNEMGASGSLKLEAEKPSVLLRQLGLQAITLSGVGKGLLEASWRPASNGNRRAANKVLQPVVDLKAQIAGTAFSFSGTAASLLPQPDLRGRLAVTSKNAAPLLQLLAFVLPNAGANTPLDVSGDFAWRGDRLSAGSIQGHLFGSKLTGQAVFAPRPAGKDISRYFLSGALRFERLGLRGLSALVFGPDEGGAGIWSSTQFHPASGDFPPGALEIEAGRFDLPGGVEGQSTRFTLRLSPGLLAFDAMTMRAGQTSLSGSMTFRNGKATSAVSGSLAFRSPAIGLHGLSGSTTGQVDFAATGNSERELVSGLAGKGSAIVKDLTVAGADPAAMQRVLKATDAERLELTDSGVRAALQKNFANAPLSFGEKTFTMAIAGGVARFETAPAKALAGDVDGKVSATFDLAKLTGLAKLDFVARARPQDWSGALPAVSLERMLQPQSGKPADAGTRIIASAFVNGVSARAIVREVARMEALEFDIRERAYFNRQIKSAQFLARRQTEIAAYRVEQARLAEEARKRAEEAARLRADAEARARIRRAAEERKAEIAARQQAAAKKAAERKAAEGLIAAEAKKALQDATHAKGWNILPGPAGAPLSPILLPVAPATAGQ